MARASWLESDAEFEGVGAHELNPRYDPVDEAEGILRSLNRSARKAFVLPKVAQAVEGRLFADASSTIEIARKLDLAVYMRRLDGMDGSHWQPDAGPVSMDILRAHTFWWAWKATQSVKFVDPTFKPFRAEAKRVEFPYRNYYHWLSSTTDPVEQALHFLRTIGPWGPGEGAMLDAEEGGITVEKCLAWLERVEENLQRPCSVYTGLYVAGGTIWRDPRIRMSKFGPRPMHLAAYISIASLLSRLKAQGVEDLPIHAWQWSSNGPVPGVTGRCDMNSIISKYAYDLACGLQISPPVPVPPTPVPPLPPLDPDQENDVADIVTNQDDFFGAAPGQMKWWAREKADGKLTLYHLNPAEWVALGKKNGTPMENPHIAELGVTPNGTWPVDLPCQFVPGAPATCGFRAMNIGSVPGQAVPT